MKEYKVVVPKLSLYDSSQCSRLATEAWAGRHLRLVVESLDFNSLCTFKDPIRIVLCEDRYECWLAPEDAKAIIPVEEGQEYQARVIQKDEIQERISDVINSAILAYQSENRYLWGGTVGPDFDCSGLVQRAYSLAGIWLPRDSYQQEEIVEKVLHKDLNRGDLLFFGVERITHVAICVEVPLHDEGCNNNEGHAPPVKYTHSSSSANGHGHIEIDILAPNAGPVTKHYFSLYRGSGRIVRGL